MYPKVNKKFIFPDIVMPKALYICSIQVMLMSREIVCA